MSQITVRALLEDQWSEYRSIRLAALKESPEAFSSSYAEESDRDEPWWRACMLRAHRLLAEREGVPIGVVSVTPSAVEERSADVYGLWVKPTIRNTGIAWRLVEAAREEAIKDGRTHLDYWVGSQNGRAIGFAINFGFRVTSRRRTARVPSEEFGDQEIALALPLTGDSRVPNAMEPRFSPPYGPDDVPEDRTEAGPDDRQASGPDHDVPDATMPPESRPAPPREDGPVNRRIEPLTLAECRELLGEQHFGRLAFVDSVGVLPMIIPVNYVLDHDTVVFRTEAGSKLRAATRGAPIAFEVDGADGRGGWSVVVRGHAKEVTDPAKLADYRHAPLVAWAPGAKPHYVTINPSQVTGRRITSSDQPSPRSG